MCTYIQVFELNTAVQQNLFAAQMIRQTAVYKYLFLELTFESSVSSMKTCIPCQTVIIAGSIGLHFSHYPMFRTPVHSWKGGVAVR